MPRKQRDRQALRRNWPPLLADLPRDLCVCGHTGSGPNSQHAARYAEGHGPCQVPTCSCQQFTWDRRLSSEKSQEGGRHE